MSVVGVVLLLLAVAAAVGGVFAALMETEIAHGLLFVLALAALLAAVLTA